MNSIGTLFIKNLCDQEIFIWSVPEEASLASTFISVLSPRQSYTERFRQVGGVSVKIAYGSVNGDASNNISQLEYTVNGQVFYDWSNINGQLFIENGFTVRPSYTHPQENCVDIICKLNDLECLGVYYQPQDKGTHSCPISTDLVVEICARTL
jgi:hypothetical protein